MDFSNKLLIFVSQSNKTMVKTSTNTETYDLTTICSNARCGKPFGYSSLQYNIPWQCPHCNCVAYVEKDYAKCVGTLDLGRGIVIQDNE